MKMNAKGVVLYIGGFELPDKNAAAQRVVGNAHALQALGYEVIFLNKTSCKNKSEISCFGCHCINSPKVGWKYLISATEVKKTIKKYKISHLIAYNYPAIALKKIIKYCKKNGVKCYADVTEWYEIKGNPLKKLFKKYDVELRMKKLHKCMDGVIAISEYLYQYYCRDVKTVKIPPLVNINEEKWNKFERENEGITVFSYVGSPSARKEKLGLIVKTIEKMSEKINAILIIVGITKAEFEQIYSLSIDSQAIIFKGRLPHEEAIQIVKQSDWSIIMRENFLFVQAGFPTKVVESISCGTPVLANKFSNIQDYLNESNSILFDGDKQLADAIDIACENRIRVDNTIFHYSKYLEEFMDLFNNTNRG